MKRRLHLIVLLALAVVLSRDASPAAAAPCVGDCQGTGREDIGSLVTLVSIALGSAPPSACPYGVPSGAPVTVALLIQAVDNALGACAEATATPTATPAVSDTAAPTPTVTPAGTSCPPGQHRACHSGSGRGGGYHRVCTCVANPPPVCRTAWGTQIAAGTSVSLYDTTTVYAPDTCAAHATQVSCSADGVLSPANATGYTVCSVVVPGEPQD